MTDEEFFTLNPMVMFKLGLSLLPIPGFLQDDSSFCSHQTLSKLAFCFAFDVKVQTPIGSVEDFAVLQRGLAGAKLAELEISDLPLPFDDATHVRPSSPWGRWLRRIEPRFCRREEIEEETWCGRFSLDSQLLTFSEPVNDIRFTIQQQDGDLVWIRGFGTGTDFEFKLEGEINPDEGCISMIKEFPGIERVRLEGRVSPFGIIGTWCYENQVEVQGFFWFWKKVYNVGRD
ncbi:hypothetical protein PG995_015981 [Apiospora arundinis]